LCGHRPMIAPPAQHSAKNAIGQARLEFCDADEHRIV
jgi:hypothetical protein